MITQIRISNFYSIGSEQIISFVKNGICPDQGFFEINKNKNVSLVNGFWGSNASGKTNILKALTTLITSIYFVPQNDIVANAQSVRLAVNPNFKKKFENLPTKLGMDFLIGSDMYSYDIHFDKGDIILFEELKLKNKSCYTRNEKGHIITNITNMEFKIAPNQSVLSIGMQLSLPFAEPIKKMNFLWNLQLDNLPNIFNYIQTAVQIKHNQRWLDEDALKKITAILKSFDSSIENIEIDLTLETPIKFKHIGFDQLVEIENESRGTQELFCYIYQITDILKNGGVIIYDEINRFFHPDIQNAIISQFLNKRINSKNAQIIFSSHDYEIISDLTKEQVNIVDKKDSETVTNQIADFKGYRTGVNQTKKVRLGLYGGMPDIGDFNYNMNEII